MIEIIDYRTRDLMQIEKKLKNSQGWRTKHIDFINNDESNGLRVTFVNGLDDPDNDPGVVAERVQLKADQVRRNELNNKPVLTMPEIRELLRLIQ